MNAYREAHKLHQNAAFRAARLHQPSNLVAAFAHVMEDPSRCLFGNCVGIPSIHVAKAVAVTGADWVWIDAEHTPFSRKELADVVQTINFHSEGTMFPVVRPPAGDHAILSTAIDAGAAGIIYPHVETAEQVRVLIDQCLYPPLGNRSYPPFALYPGITDISLQDGGNPFQTSNAHIAVLPQVESKKGVENIEEIMSVPGVTAVFVGMTDLRLSLGLPAQSATMNEPIYLAALAKVEAAAKAKNIPLCGLHFDPSTIKQKIDSGYKMLCVTADVYSLIYKSIADLSAMRAAMK